MRGLKCLTLIFTVVLAMTAARVEADIVEFALDGKAGRGLLGGNVNPPSSQPGSGGIGSTGILLDTSNNILHIDVEWGSENGYTDLSGDAILLHMHGPTDDPAPASYFQNNTNLIINLGNSLRFRPSASDGGLIDDFFLSNQEIGWLLEGRLYIQVHTNLNPMGELRGYLIPVPEPADGVAVIVLTVLCGTVLGMRRQRLRWQPARANSRGY